MISLFVRTNLLKLARRLHCSTSSKRRRELLDSDEEDHGAEDLENHPFPSDITDEEIDSSSYEPSTSLLAQGRSGGVFPVCLPTIHTPKALEEAIREVISRHNRKQLRKDGETLTKYLYDRIPVGCEWKVDSKKMSTAEETSSSRKSERSSFNSNIVWATKPHKPITSDDNHSMKAMKWAPVVRYRKRECLAYLAGRAQASYGTALRALSEISTLDPSYSPGTLLDFGSGLGTVEWAAHHLWAESMYEYQCVDISQDMLDLAKSLRLGGVDTEDMLDIERRQLKECIPGVYSRQYLPLSRKNKYDLVVSAYTLGELASVSLRKFAISTLWRKTNDYLVIIEQGTWSGYKLILEARSMILNATDWTLFGDECVEDLVGHVVAPCPHDYHCPFMLEKQPKRPCHFAQRVQLSEAEKGTHLDRLSCHIEGFTYLIVKKGPRRPSSNSHQARLIEPPRKRSRHVNCRLCSSEGNAEKCTFTKSKHRNVYRGIRKSKWGDLITVEALSNLNDYHE